MSENSSQQPWSQESVIGLAIATFFIPVVGMVAGIVGLQRPATKEQGGGLLAWGVFMAFVWYSVFRGL
jgi:hypothetical protein